MKLNNIKILTSVLGVLWCLSYTLTSHAQVNLKIGYNLDYSAHQSHNAVIKQYNQVRPWLNSEFSDLHISNALQIGARFRREYVGADITWERSSNDKTAQGTIPNGDQFTKTLDYVTNRFGAGLETYTPFFGIGANVYLERFSISGPIQNSESSNSIMKSDRFGSRVYLIFTANSGDWLSLSFQPYVALPYTQHNFDQLSNHLNVNSNENLSRRDLHFGFSIVFYNGLQSY